MVARVQLATPRHPRLRATRLITALDVVPDADDHGQLVPMVARVEATTGRGITTVLSDGGYHDGATVAARAVRGQRVVMPEAQAKALTDPSHNDHFPYAPATDTSTCPEAHPLTYRRTKARTERPLTRGYRGEVAVCRDGAAFGRGTTDRRQGRALESGPHEDAVRAHRAWLATEEATMLYRQRKELIAPVFGVLKEERGARRFLLRGVANVRAEWTRLATAFHLRTCVRVWQRERAAAGAPRAGDPVRPWPVGFPATPDTIPDPAPSAKCRIP